VARWYHRAVTKALSRQGALALRPTLPIYCAVIAAIACSGAAPASSGPPAPTVAAPATPTPGAATAAPAATPSANGPLNLTLEPVATRFQRPLFVTSAGDGSGDLYVVEQRGAVRVVRQGRVDTTPFLDIIDSVGSDGSEQGLLGLAFHPNYPRNSYIYVNYTDKRGNTVIARYTATAGGRTVDRASAKTILAFDQPYPNHNGGMLLFGPDGMLWIGAGDGGSGGDPHGNGQNRNALLGKMLRIDVDRGAPYAIPPDNPFAATPGARPEAWAIGLRNPWRFSFDRATGNLFIADVGQNSWEEIDFTPAGARPPLNYGWSVMEATHCFPADRQGCNRDGLTLPIAEYRTGPDGCAVTGGYVYRGRRFPQLTGRYLFSDFCKGFLAALTQQNGAWTRTELMPPGPINISSFGEDQDGELYVTGYNTGTLYRVVAK